MYHPGFAEHYFSGPDGLAEKRHVFVLGNQLPERFAQGGHVTIAELGFGLGLNFMAVWQAFLQHAPAHAQLTFYSIEAEPLAPAALAQAHAPYPQLTACSSQLCQQLVQGLSLTPGLNHFTLSPQVTLKLFIGDVTAGLAACPQAVQAWCLDGFSPAKNPAMWGPLVWQTLKKNSAPQATASTYSVARVVRDGLSQAGFTWQKTKGYGHKTEMLMAQKKEAPRAS